MKRSMLIRVLSVLLVVCMLSTNVYAASSSRTGKFGTGTSWLENLRDWLGGWNNSGSTVETEPEETEPEETEPEITEGETTNNTVMTLIEDETTVEDSSTLRASTYALTTYASDDYGTSTTAETTTVLKYFPVTLFDYDADTINSVTHQLEVDKGLGEEWKGMYFSGGAPAAKSYIYETDEIVTIASGYMLVVPEFDSNGYITNLDTNKEYIFVSKRGGQAIYDNNSSSSNAFKRTSVAGGIAFAYTNNVTEWTLTASGDGYNIKSDRSSYYNYYMYIGNGTGYSATTSSPSTIYIKEYSGDSACVTLSRNSYYLNHYGGDDGNTFAGYASESDAGAAFYIYEVATNIEVNQAATDSLPFAGWNFWNKGSGENANGDLMYTGLVESKLDSNKDIVFTVPEGGIFNDDTSVKSIYTNVELPFVYSSDGYYTFNSAVNGVYFHEDSTQGSSGTAASNTRLYFDEGDPQAWTGMEYGDGSSNLWAPFNDGDPSSASDVNYHFGMNATIPFTMTTDGKVQQGVEKSDDIQFTFSGDDDVWVFIDGVLVIDLGGIHNRLDATINFAENTVNYSESNTQDDDATTGSYNDSTFQMTQQLFNTSDSTGLINQDLATFAATDNHELTIFYLERGEGSSNSQIKFNLPVKDVVSVRKTIAGQAAYNSDGTVTTTDLSSLTDAQLAVLNNQEFTFTLYRNGTVVANATYLLLNANGQVIATPSTDANGQFVLKNGQTAKFTGTISSNAESADTYYVVEEVKNGFIYTEYTYSADVAVSSSATGTATHTYVEKDEAHYITNMSYGSITSQAVTVVGGSEAEDSLAFVCNNYMNATLPTPSAIPDDDKVVIDYGLPVVIDLFSNDLHLADYTQITFPSYATNDGGAYVANYGTFVDNGDGTITYTLNQQLTGVEVINYTLTGYAETETEVVAASGTANIYIIPATTMYYEENFGLVTYADGKSSGWTVKGTPETDNQEPGVVGTVGDSPYGSDVAYLNDSGDSNGSSMYVDTTNGAAQFSYTFTGTGTSFYVRTNNNSGYMRVVVYDTSDTTGQTYDMYYIDTWYDDSNSSVKGTLYNIPVFTYEAENYGTYKVVVTIAQENEIHGYHNEFWVDGIRVYEPLNSTDGNYSVGTSAYATDGEANMTNVTLRNKLIGEADYNENDELVYNGGNFVLFTDTNGAITTVEGYSSIGPKEEVYLYNGQSVTFSLTNWDTNTNKVYLGIKAPTGSGTVTIGTTSLTINNAADCYYEIGSYGTITTNSSGVKTITFTITAGSDSLISLTNIKVTGSAEFTIVDGEDIQVDGEDIQGD